MGQTKITPKGVKHLIEEDSKVSGYLKYVGLFGFELGNYFLEQNTVRPSLTGLHHRNAEFITYTLLGRNHSIKFNRGSKSLYYLGNFHGDFAGYPRILLEMRDDKSGRVIEFIERLANEGQITTAELDPRIRQFLYESRLRKIVNTGLVSKGENSVTATDALKRIFSHEVLDAWEDLKTWKHKIKIA